MYPNVTVDTLMVRRCYSTWTWQMEGVDGRADTPARGSDAAAPAACRRRAPTVGRLGSRVPQRAPPTAPRTPRVPPPTTTTCHWASQTHW